MSTREQAIATALAQLLDGIQQSLANRGLDALTERELVIIQMVMLVVLNGDAEVLESCERRFQPRRSALEKRMKDAGLL